VPTRRGFHQGRTGRTRRGVGWEEGPGASTQTGLSASGSVILGLGLELLVDDFTLMRTRGRLSAFLNTGSAAGEGFHCAMGIGIVTKEAFAIGITAVPIPITNMDWDGWLYHQFFDCHVRSTTNVDTDSAGITFEVDSKAMRKLRDGDTIFAVLEVVEIGAATMDVFFDSRVLLKAA